MTTKELEIQYVKKLEQKAEISGLKLKEALLRKSASLIPKETLLENIIGFITPG